MSDPTAGINGKHSESTVVEIVRARLANGRTIADYDVHKLVGEIDRLACEREILRTESCRWRNAAIALGHVGYFPNIERVQTNG